MAQSTNEIPGAVAESVSDTADIPVEELPPLSSVIDPGALQTILSAPETEPIPDVMVTFEYAGHRVFAHPGEIVDVRPIHGRKNRS